MRVRFGYVAIAMRLDKVTSSSPVTYKKYSSIESERERLSLLKRVTQSNLIDLIKILKYNIENDIHFYRLTSKLIPLATHQDVVWNYSKVIQTECQEVAKLIKQSSMRVDAHPDQFNVLNSINESVIESSIRTLEHQLDLFDLFAKKFTSCATAFSICFTTPDTSKLFNLIHPTIIAGTCKPVVPKFTLFIRAPPYKIHTVQLVSQSLFLLLGPPSPVPQSWPLLQVP